MKYWNGYSYISNLEGERRNIVVKSSFLKHPSSLVALAIDITMIGIGIFGIANTAFKHGADSFEDAEYHALDELHLFRK